MPRPPKGPIIIDTYLHLVYSKDDSITDFNNWYQEQVRMTSVTHLPRILTSYDR